MVSQPSFSILRHRITPLGASAIFVTGTLAVAASGCARPIDSSAPGPDSTHRVDRTAASDPDTCRIGARRAYLGHAKGYVARLEKLQAEVRARLDSGEATATDLAQVQARLADARARLVRARADLAIARADLAAATGRYRACAPTP